MSNIDLARQEIEARTHWEITEVCALDEHDELWVAHAHAQKGDFALLVHGQQQVRLPLSVLGALEGWCHDQGQQQTGKKKEKEERE